MGSWFSPSKKAEANAGKAQSNRAMGSASLECSKNKLARIVKIEWLDDSDSTGKAKKLLGGKGLQFVNLPRDDRFVDGKIVKNLDRLSNMPRFRVEFDQPGSHSFKVKPVPGGGNAVYSETEKARNANFTYDANERSFSTDKDGSKVVDGDVYLAVASNNSYRLEATDENGNRITSAELLTWRLVHYVEIKMKGLKSIAKSTAIFRDEFKKHFIFLNELPSLTMDRLENIGSETELSTFKENARKAYENSMARERDPHVIAIVYTDHLAVKAEERPLLSDVVAVGPGRAPVTIFVEGIGDADQSVQPRPLWMDLVAEEGWFVRAEYWPAGGGSLPIAQEACTAVPWEENPAAAYWVKVDVTRLPAGKGVVRVFVNWVDRFRGGISLGDGNAVCIGTRAYWTDIPQAEQVQVMIHEVGHQFQMAADGRATLDPVSTVYEGWSGGGTRVRNGVVFSSQGHIGSHCHAGIPAGQLRYDSSADAQKAACVMYGAVIEKTAFCPECARALRKVDLNGGHAAF